MSETKHAIRKNAPMALVLCVLFLAMTWPQIEARVAENRWYRDAVGLSPFSLVEVTHSEVVDGGLAIIGVMRKNRCDFVQDAQVGYVYFEGKPRRRTTVDTSPEDRLTGVVGQSRPPSDKLEQWGPWIINWRGATPDRWEIFVDHENCPTPPENQTNKFASGPWADVAPQKEKD